MIKWNITFNFNEQTWKQIYKLPFIITQDTKLQSFQFRINHLILGTNWLLNKINSNHDSKCHFCKLGIDTVQHIFWDCEKVKLLLAEFQTSLKHGNVQLIFTKDTLIFGLYHIPNTNLSGNIILVWMKYYIFKCKQQKSILNITGLKNSMKFKYQTEKYINISNDKINSYLEQWKQWIPYFDRHVNLYLHIL